MRRILHHGPTPLGVPVLLDDRAIGGCWFELHRQGGCGAGEVILRDRFTQRQAIDIGDWISFEVAPGDRWYLGRVEELHAQSPAQIRMRLEGMCIELNEIYPGGFGPEGQPPHRYANTDLFSNDPDRSLESVDIVATADDAIRLLVQQYVTPSTHISLVSDDIEAPAHSAPVTSLKFRGEESIRTIVKDLAMRADASWGVDAHGRFFFRRRRSTLLATWREGRDLTFLAETRDRDLLFNRVLLTGDYVYDLQDYSGQVARRSYRFRGNFIQPVSRDQFGERRIRLWIPWVRTQADAIAFLREFFRTYSQPTSRFLIETLPQSTLPLPWDGVIRLEDRNGTELTSLRCESIRVAFDHTPQFRLELGPADPRELWPEPPYDERWELPEVPPPGGEVTYSDFPPPTFTSDGDIDPPGTSLETTSTGTSWSSLSDLSSDLSSSDESSDFDSSSGDTTEDTDTSAPSDSTGSTESGTETSAPGSDSSSGVSGSMESDSLTWSDSSDDSLADLSFTSAVDNPSSSDWSYSDNSNWSSEEPLSSS